jgi:hypothetical protein
MAVMAARLDIDLATFKAWTARLEPYRDYVEPVQTTAEILRASGRRADVEDD